MWTTEDKTKKLLNSVSPVDRKASKLIASHGAPLSRCRQRTSRHSSAVAFAWRIWLQWCYFRCFWLADVLGNWNGFGERGENRIKHNSGKLLTLGWWRKMGEHSLRPTSTLSTAATFFSIPTQHCERNSINGNFFPLLASSCTLPRLNCKCSRNFSLESL